ncbi:MAG: hypothetical protein GX558_01025, partial [Clostridiales bacterium]|nr:hypothetical protein [Clostridiales bacterium]
MRKEKLPDALLAIFLAAVLIGFGAMTWIAGGRNIVSTAASAPARVGATAPFDVIKAAIKGVQSELNLSFFAKREWVAVRNVLVRLLGK